MHETFYLLISLANQDLESRKRAIKKMSAIAVLFNLVQNEVCAKRRLLHDVLGVCPEPARDVAGVCAFSVLSG